MAEVLYISAASWASRRRRFIFEDRAADGV